MIVVVERSPLRERVKERCKYIFSQYVYSCALQALTPGPGGAIFFPDKEGRMGGGSLSVCALLFVPFEGAVF